MSEEKKIHEGAIHRVKWTKKDGSKLISPRSGEPWCIVTFKTDDGGWLDVTCFDTQFHPILAAGNVVKVAYTESVKVDDFGEPMLYNGNKQWNRSIRTAKLISGKASAGDSSAPAGGKPYDSEFGAKQTAANDATQWIVGLMHMVKPGADVDGDGLLKVRDAVYTPGADVDGDGLLKVWDAVYTHIHDTLTGKLETLVAAAQEKLDATPVQEDMDDDIPF